MRNAPAPERRFEERLALLACALKCTEPLALLEGLAEPLREHATAEARRVIEWDSASRQATVAQEFGVRDDAPQQVRELIAQAGPSLGSTIYRLLPPFLRTAVPGFVSAPEPTSKLAQTFAARSIKEATR
jgi:hypothetical protein